MLDGVFMSKPLCKAESYWWSVIKKEVKHLSPTEIHFNENDATYAKRQASKARRRDARISKCEGYDQWRDMVGLMFSMCADWPEYTYPEDFSA